MVINFNDDLYSQLSDGNGTSPDIMRWAFPPWDVLAELERRERRGQAITERDIKVREYMKENPDVVEKLRKQLERCNGNTG
jgi:hypothetical protein